jgi:hypothetical protein
MTTKKNDTKTASNETAKTNPTTENVLAPPKAKDVKADPFNGLKRGQVVHHRDQRREGLATNQPHLVEVGEIKKLYYGLIDRLPHVNIKWERGGLEAFAPDVIVDHNAPLD